MFFLCFILLYFGGLFCRVVAQRRSIFYFLICGCVLNSNFYKYKLKNHVGNTINVYMNLILIFQLKWKKTYCVKRARINLFVNLEKKTLKILLQLLNLHGFSFSFLFIYWNDSRRTCIAYCSGNNLGWSTRE